jgi:hypothetical protein
VRGASGMVTTLPPLRVITRVLRAVELGCWLGARRRRRRILVAFPGRLCFPAYCAFRGERAVFAGGFTFPERVVAGPLLRAPRVPGLLTWLADQWPGMWVMPRECARGRRRVGRWGRRWLVW